MLEYMATVFVHWEEFFLSIKLQKSYMDLENIKARIYKVGVQRMGEIPFLGELWRA